MNSETKNEMKEFTNLYLRDCEYAKVSDLVEFLVGASTKKVRREEAMWVIKSMFKSGEISSAICGDPGLNNGIRYAWLGALPPGDLKIRWDEPTKLSSDFESADLDRRCDMVVEFLSGRPEGSRMHDLQSAFNPLHLRVGSWGGLYDEIYRILKLLKSRQRIEMVKRRGFAALYYACKRGATKKAGRKKETRTQTMSSSPRANHSPGLWVKMDGVEYGPFSGPSDAVAFVKAARQ